MTVCRELQPNQQLQPDSAPVGRTPEAAEETLSANPADAPHQCIHRRRSVGASLPEIRIVVEHTVVKTNPWNRPSRLASHDAQSSPPHLIRRWLKRFSPHPIQYLLGRSRATRRVPSRCATVATFLLSRGSKAHEPTQPVKRPCLRPQPDAEATLRVTRSSSHTVAVEVVTER